MKRIVVICKGGFGTEMQVYIEDTFGADSGYRLDRVQDLFPDDDFKPQPDEVYVVANGDPVVKAKLVQKIQLAGGAFVSVIHPKCYVASTATVGVGAILCPFAFVGPYATLAPHVTMNVHSGVGHNGAVGQYTVFSPYASAAGATVIGEGVFFGSYAFVAPEKRVGDNAKLSQGACVLGDIPANALAVGNPARCISGFYS